MPQKSLRINLTASWVSHAVALLVGFLLMPVVLRTLGDSAYGTWLFLNSIASIAGLMYLGFGDVVARYVAKYYTERDSERLNRTVSIVFAVYSSMSVIVLVATALLAWSAASWHDWGNEPIAEVRWAILILGLNIAVGMAGSVFSGVLMGIQRFDLQRSITIVADLVRAGLTLLLLKQESGLVTLALIVLAISVCENLASLLLALRKVPGLSVHWRFLHRETARECFGFSAFAFLSTIASQLIYATDALVIGVWIGNEAIIPYNIAMRLCQLVRRPIQQIGEVCTPKAGELQAAADSSALRKLVVRTLGMSFLLTCAFFIGAAFFGDAVIRTWVGDKYVSGHRLLMVLLGAQIIALPMWVLRSIMFGLGRVRGPSLLYLLEAVANLVLSIVLVRPFGVMGVALGTAIPIVVIELGLLLPYALRALHLRAREALSAALGPQLVPLVVLVAYSAVVETRFDISTGWDKLAPVTLGGGAVLIAACTARWYLARGSGRGGGEQLYPAAPTG